MNKVNLFGRLTRDPESHITTSGKNVTRFTLAVERYVPADAPPNTQKADFIPCSVWGKRGDVIAKYCRKGNRLLVAGELRITPYTTKEGLRRDMVEINVNDFSLIDRNDTSGSTQTVATPSVGEKTVAGPRPGAGNRPSPSFNSPFDEEVPF